MSSDRDDIAKKSRLIAGNLENSKSQVSELDQKCVDRLRDFASDLASGKDIVVTDVQRIETPDGPKIIRRKRIVKAGEPLGPERIE